MTDPVPSPVRTVLVIDHKLAQPDAPAYLRLLASDLRGHGLEVVEASSCEEGLARYATHPGIHCVLFDWALDGSDPASPGQGTRLLRALGERIPRTPVFVLLQHRIAVNLTLEMANLVDDFIWLPDDQEYVVRRALEESARYARRLEAAVTPGLGPSSAA